jgi:hypothetical protein
MFVLPTFVCVYFICCNAAVNLIMRLCRNIINIDLYILTVTHQAIPLYKTLVYMCYTLLNCTTRLHGSYTTNEKSLEKDPVYNT